MHKRAAVVGVGRRERACQPKAARFGRDVDRARAKRIFAASIQRTVEWIGRRDVGLRARDPSAKLVEEAELTRAGANQMKCVYRASLSDAVDTADTLLQSHGIPWQLQIDDDAAALMQVETFARRVGGE
jgi:hypothetical protein